MTPGEWMRTDAAQTLRAVGKLLVEATERVDELGGDAMPSVMRRVGQALPLLGSLEGQLERLLGVEP